MHWSRFAAALPAALLLAACLGGAFAQDGMMPERMPHMHEARESFISVEGRGVAFGEPDVATLELGVTATDPDVRTAVARLDEGVAAVSQALRALGVPDRAIRTTAYNVWREERFPQEGEGSARISFRAQHMLSVELQGTRQAGEALAAAVEAGANAVGGITFGFSNPAELERRAREAAVADARARAEQLALAAGVTLGSPLAIREIAGERDPVQPFERSAAVLSAPIEAGELSVEVRVAIDYRLESSP
jgi:uncharacterized protein YggE